MIPDSAKHLKVSIVDDDLRKYDIFLHIRVN